MKEKHILMYMRMAYATAATSSSTRLQVGCVIVNPAYNRNISNGYNALPEHINGPLEDENGNTRPEVRHAEKNALMGLTKSNESSLGSYMFCTHSCCVPCAIDIVDAGVTKFFYSETYRCTEGLNYLRRNLVEVIHVPLESVL